MKLTPDFLNFTPIFIKFYPSMFFQGCRYEHYRIPSVGKNY